VGHRRRPAVHAARPDPADLAIGWVGALIWFGSGLDGLRVLDPETGAWRAIFLPDFLPTPAQEQNIQPVALVQSSASLAPEPSLRSTGVPGRITEGMRVRFTGPPSWGSTYCIDRCAERPYELTQVIDGRSRLHDELCGPVPIAIGTTRDSVERAAQRLAGSVTPSEGTSVRQRRERIGANTYTHVAISFIECGVDYWITRAGSTTYVVRAFEYLIENDPSVKMVMESLVFG
jgi:hypothetical protein